MEFKGYDVSKDGQSISAWFVRKGASGPATRRPNRARGGVARAAHRPYEYGASKTETHVDVNQCKKARWPYFPDVYGPDDPEL